MPHRIEHAFERQEAVEVDALAADERTGLVLDR